ncbi:hypothetical protein Clacol_001102 [Clathrus columnatus]|uniref:Uncharacterized protein n=1 Tax=Clathrus columnatus TaxID=1419009 RepID=A0AAV5A2W8_9AGAM|nr:hypothetical protein Clacol_001102 [Clathrus columnatus]
MAEMMGVPDNNPLVVSLNVLPLTIIIPFINTLLSVLKTLFLFTKSDFKTTILPVTIFAATTAPVIDFSSILQSIFWTWLHLFQFTLANQSLGYEEDMVNKPDRPIPSGRISVEHTQLLRWLSIIPCFVLSAYYSPTTLRVSIAFAILTFLYNEMALSANWFTRNVLNGFGVAAFEAGATLVAGRNTGNLDPSARLAVIIGASLFATTIHTQDFKDVFGDKKAGRRTLPMIFPIASRISVFVLIMAWSFGLRSLWKTGPILSAILIALGSLVGSRFLFLHSVKADQHSYYLYNAEEVISE